MKIMVKLFAVVSLVSIFLTGCASTNVDGGNVKPGKYVGTYDENMTPENSCLIYFSFPWTETATFKQINPAFESDEQVFKYGFDIYGATVFKPVKPGSRYMLTKIKGNDGSNTRFDMNFSRDQEYFVINVPKKPGVYYLGYMRGSSVAINAFYGNASEVNEPNTPTKVNKIALKKMGSAMKKYYKGTPWYDAFIENRDFIMNSPTIDE